MSIYFERTGPLKGKDFMMPKRATGSSAGYDLYNNTGEEIVVRPGEISDKISTGVKIIMPSDIVLALDMRSGHGFKRNVRLANTIGVIDADYANNEDNDGEIFVKYYNPSDNEKTLVIKKGEGMVQGILLQYLLIDGDSYGVGATRTSGIGSTT
jgi:dUTP pyrophosphatase